jgi:cytochrome c peroxidase
LIAIAPILLLSLLYLLLPDPGPRIRLGGMNDQELREIALQLQGPSPGRLAEAHIQQSQQSDGGPRLAAFGRQLFQAANLSPTGNVSCAHCHGSAVLGAAPSAAPAADAGGPAKVNLPLVNEGLAVWFGAAGDSDSLAAAAVHALEDPAQMGGSRLFVVGQMLGAWRANYEQIFGKIPEALSQAGVLPPDGMPAEGPLKLQVEVAAAGLSSLGDSHLLEAILLQASQDHAAPVVELSHRAFARPAPPATWVAAYEGLSVQQREAVNQVVANVGLALAAYIEGLVAFDSPFDQFAERWRSASSASAAFGPGFGDRELAGLKLFAGPGRCLTCHDGPGFSDQKFHNIGLPQFGEAVAAGRSVGAPRVLADPFNCIGPYLGGRLGGRAKKVGDCALTVTLPPSSVAMLGAFKTPSLRNVAQRSRYMHDGRYSTLPTVLGYYSDLDDHPAIGVRDPRIQQVSFTKEELAALGDFLTALSSPVRDLNDLNAIEAK